MEKQALLESSSCGLQAEQFLGNGDAIENETHKVRLADVCEAILTGPFGSSLHQSDYISNGIPVINPQNIVNGRIVPDAEKTVGAETRNRLSEFTVRENDIVIGRRGEMGRCAIVTAEMNGWLCGTGSFVIRVNSSALASFMALAISSPKAKEFLEENAIGVTLKNLNQQVLGDLEIPLPPLEEQRRIVAEIEGYQEILDGARQILAGYKPTLEPTPDWTVTTLGEACEKIMDGTHFSPKNQAEGKYRYITAKNIKEMRLSLDDVTFISEEAHREIYRRCPVRKGDVLYIKDGATTGIAALNPLEEEFSLLSSVAVLRGKQDVLDDRFLAYYLNSPKGKSYMLGMVSGVAITRLTLTKLNDAEIPLPPLTEQRRLVVELDAEAAQMEAVRALLPRFEAKIQRVLDRVWGTAKDE